MLKKYCKAYYLKDLRQFADWSESNEEGAPALSDEDVVYLWDDFTVVKSPVLPGGVLFSNVTPQWRNFCETTLQFSIPEDLRYAYEENRETKESTTENEVVESSPAGQ
jgi:hypothetical protein